MAIVGKIISGGQTGADQGALKAARRMGLRTGGAAPKGYLTELGPRPDLLKGFGLVEHESATYSLRTAANVFDADATLILGTELDRGSTLTANLCRKYGRPFRVVTDASPAAAEAVASWLCAEHERRGRPLTLDVAGNRESHEPGLEARAEDFLVRVLALLAG
ncbi:MAG TPA: putative molybdenum carrier protein [Stellaceae bacterium]|nr:putative molybdenum carrier protein [Stellaceae bacterium]